MIRVLLVEDSQTVATFIATVLAGESDIELLPVARDGVAALEAVAETDPQVVLMDLELPGLDGIEVIRSLMAVAPRPIIVLSGVLNADGRNRTFEAFEVGAVDVIAKPGGLGAEQVRTFRGRLLQAIRTMVHARVVRRRDPSLERGDGVNDEVAARGLGPCRLLAIGASTGGPPVLYDILRGIREFPCPVIIGQHIVSGFEAGLARWLASTGHRVEVADRVRDTPIVNGRIVLLPAEGVARITGGLLQIVPDQVPDRLHAIDSLFFAAAEQVGGDAVGVLLTGMGADGANGLAALRRAGAMTITQAGSTCVVNGMPEAARRLGASRVELSPEAITAYLAGIFRARGEEVARSS